MLAQFSGSTTATKVKDSFTAMSLTTLLLLPSYHHSIPVSDKPLVSYKTEGDSSVRFKSDAEVPSDLYATLQKIVNYFLEEEPEIPVEIAMTTRKRFGDMYVRF